MSSRYIMFENISIGMKASCSKQITDCYVKLFCELSGDHNPIHMDDSFANNSRFKKRIAHGLISGSFFQLYSERNCLALVVFMYLNHSSLKNQFILAI